MARELVVEKLVIAATLGSLCDWFKLLSLSRLYTFSHVHADEVFVFSCHGNSNGAFF